MNKFGAVILAFMTGVAIVNKQYMAATSMVFFAVLFINLPEKSAKK